MTKSNSNELPISVPLSFFALFCSLNDIKELKDNWTESKKNSKIERYQSK